MTKHDAMLKALEAAEEYRIAKRFQAQNPETTSEEVVKFLDGARLFGLVKSAVDSRHDFLVSEGRWPEWWKLQNVTPEEAELAVRFEVQIAKFELFGELSGEVELS